MAAPVVAAAAGAATGAAAAVDASVFLGSALVAFFSPRFLKAALSFSFRLSRAPSAAGWHRVSDSAPSASRARHHRNTSLVWRAPPRLSRWLAHSSSRHLRDGNSQLTNARHDCGCWWSKRGTASRSTVDAGETQRRVASFRRVLMDGRQAVDKQRGQGAEDGKRGGKRFASAPATDK